MKWIYDLKQLAQCVTSRKILHIAPCIQIVTLLINNIFYSYSHTINIEKVIIMPESACTSNASSDAAQHSPASGTLTLITGKREVGSVWVSQTREGDSMLGVIIEEINYIGFKVVNDDDLKAPHYRLYCVDASGELQEKGQVWKLITGVEKRRKKPSRDKPVTTLFIRIDKQGADSSDSADNQVLYPPDSASAAKYYIGKMKDQVSLHPSGSGLMGERYPAFSVFKREFAFETPPADDADNVAGCGVKKTEMSAATIPASGDTKESALAEVLEGSAEARIWAKSLDAAMSR